MGPRPLAQRCNNTHCYSTIIISKDQYDDAMRIGRLHLCHPPQKKNDEWIGKIVRSKKWTRTIEYDKNENILPHGSQKIVKILNMIRTIF